MASGSEPAPRVPQHSCPCKYQNCHNNERNGASTAVENDTKTNAKEDNHPSKCSSAGQKPKNVHTSRPTLSWAKKTIGLEGSLACRMASAGESRIDYDAWAFKYGRNVIRALIFDHVHCDNYSSSDGTRQTTFQINYAYVKEDNDCEHPENNSPRLCKIYLLKIPTFSKGSNGGFAPKWRHANKGLYSCDCFSSTSWNETQFRFTKE